MTIDNLGKAKVCLDKDGVAPLYLMNDVEASDVAKKRNNMEEK